KAKTTSTTGKLSLRSKPRASRKCSIRRSVDRFFRTSLPYDQGHRYSKATMKKSTAIYGILISIFLGLGQTGCNQAAVETANRESNAQTGGEVVVAIAELQPTEGNQANGIVTFTKVADGIRVDVDITGLGENSE